MTRLLLRNGYVHTPADPHATALAVEDGVIVWTGDDDASVHFEDNAERVVDLGGRLVTPAFVDSHAHLAQSGFAATGLDLTTTANLHEALDALAAFSHNTAAPVLLGHGWDETRWPEGRVLTRDEIDRATDGRPVYLARVDEHSAVVSTSFLDACPEVAHADGYDADGRVERDAHHAAREGLFRLLTPSQREDAVLRALQDAAGHGIAMVHELGAPHICPAEDLVIARGLTERSALPEVVGYWGELATHEGVLDRAVATGLAGLAGDLCMDGSIGSRTTALHAPYADADTRGHLYLDSEQVAAHVVACTRAGLQAGFHVIGDLAAAEMVEGFRAAAKELGEQAVVQGRHRVEHLEMVSLDEMAELGRLGVTASVQPVFDELWGGEDGLYAQRLGTERAVAMNPFASLNRAGVAL
ncbi:MAG: amidohydrolase, partial [Nocardioidaceae bacterium]